MVAQCNILILLSYIITVVVVVESHYGLTMQDSVRKTIQCQSIPTEEIYNFSRFFLLDWDYGLFGCKYVNLNADDPTKEPELVYKCFVDWIFDPNLETFSVGSRQSLVNTRPSNNTAESGISIIDFRTNKKKYCGIKLLSGRRYYKYTFCAFTNIPYKCVPDYMRIRI